MKYCLNTKLRLPALTFSVFVPACVAACAAALLPVPAVAQTTAEVPYWASIRADEVNMRVGPGEDYRINWVFRRVHLPVKVLRIKEGWRLVQDPEGTRGWMLARFLTRDRGGYVQPRGEQGQALADMRAEPGEHGKLLWRLKPGVTGRLGQCDSGWCRFELEGRVGFVREEHIWGAGLP